MAFKQGILIFALSFAVASSLKCISEMCQISSMAGAPSCAPSKEIECKPMYGQPTPPDRCMVQKFSMVPQPGITVDSVVRNCSYSYACATPTLICNQVNASANGIVKSCSMGCCEGDLCNNGDVPTQGPRPTGPSGSDLSCYTCSNMPGFGADSVSCKNPVQRTCGMDPLTGAVQDRCLSVKVSGMVNGTARSYEMKNCSTAMYCAGDMFCNIANTTAMGKLSTCVISCCLGNNCNPPTSSPPGTVAATTAVGPSSSASANRVGTGLVVVLAVVMATLRVMSAL